MFGETDKSVCSSVVVIQGQSTLALSDALARSTRSNLHCSQSQMGHGMLRAHRESPDSRRLGSVEIDSAITCHNRITNYCIDSGSAYHRFNVVRIERQSTLEKLPSLRERLWSLRLVQRGSALKAQIQRVWMR